MGVDIVDVVQRSRGTAYSFFCGKRELLGSQARRISVEALQIIKLRTSGIESFDVKLRGGKVTGCALSELYLRLKVKSVPPLIQNKKRKKKEINSARCIKRAKRVATFILFRLLTENTCNTYTPLFRFTSLIIFNNNHYEFSVTMNVNKFFCNAYTMVSHSGRFFIFIRFLTNVRIQSSNSVVLNRCSVNLER